MVKASFISVLKGNSSVENFFSFPKTDFHNHLALGGSFSEFCRRANVQLPEPPAMMSHLREMNDYIFEVLRQHINTRNGLELALRLAFEQAVHDGVTILEGSIDCFLVHQYPDGIEGLIRYLKLLQSEFHDRVEYRPEIGFSRQLKLNDIESKLIPCIESGYFTSIDLYGEELSKSAHVFRDIYRLAGRYNMKRKSHVGEFGTADDIRNTVEVLELDEVQHGIAAASSPEIMRWLSENKIRLNICPTSNILLSRVPDMRAHPARILFDYGIPLSINTDDYFIFHQSVSEEYQNLYNSGVFTAEELDEIRISNLNS